VIFDLADAFLLLLKTVGYVCLAAVLYWTACAIYGLFLRILQFVIFGSLELKDFCRRVIRRGTTPR
jgi:hypothetical protein